MNQPSVSWRNRCLLGAIVVVGLAWLAFLAVLALCGAPR